MLATYSCPLSSTYYRHNIVNLHQNIEREPHRGQSLRQLGKRVDYFYIWKLWLTVLTFRRLMYRTANLQSCILYIYATNEGTEYFKHGV